MSNEAFNKLLSFLRTIRFGWIIPFILLAKGEEPNVQLRAILSGVIVPLLAIGIFLFGWNIASKQIVTKFGTVPGPRQVTSAWGSLMNEIRLEKIKKEDHFRRLREKRLGYVTKYEAVINDLGPIPDLTPTPKNTKALETLSIAFEEIQELLEVSNKVSVEPDPDTARTTVEGFKFESSRTLGATVVKSLLPIELAYTSAEEEWNLAPKYNPVDGDSEETLLSKTALKSDRAKSLAATKADLLIERQRITSLATDQSVAILEAVPNSTRKTLRKIDANASALAPILSEKLERVLADEAAGTKYKNKAKLKIMTKNFSEKPYPGKDTYVSQIFTSLKTVFAGFIIASLIAIPLGVVCGLNKTINNAFNPLIQIFKPVSPLAWLPIVMIVVGALYSSEDPMFEISFINSAITVALCSLWPTLVNTALGVASTDKDFLNVARVLKLSWTKKIFKVVLPAALPLIFTGLRLSLGVGWMVLIAAEMLAQNPGLGKFVWDMFQNGSSETLSMIMVAVFTIGVIGFALDTIMLSLQQLVSFGEAI